MKILLKPQKVRRVHYGKLTPGYRESIAKAHENFMLPGQGHNEDFYARIETYKTKDFAQMVEDNWRWHTRLKDVERSDDRQRVLEIMRRIPEKGAWPYVSHWASDAEELMETNEEEDGELNVLNHGDGWHRLIASVELGLPTFDVLFMERKEQGEHMTTATATAKVPVRNLDWWVKQLEGDGYPEKFLATAVFDGWLTDGRLLVRLSPEQQAALRKRLGKRKGLKEVRRIDYRSVLPLGKTLGLALTVGASYPAEEGHSSFTVIRHPDGTEAYFNTLAVRTLQRWHPHAEFLATWERGKDWRDCPIFWAGKETYGALMALTEREYFEGVVAAGAK